MDWSSGTCEGCARSPVVQGMHRDLKTRYQQDVKTRETMPVRPLPTLDQQLRLWHSAGNQCISLQGILPASAIVTVMSTEVRVSTWTAKVSDAPMSKEQYTHLYSHGVRLYRSSAIILVQCAPIGALWNMTTMEPSQNMLSKWPVNWSEHTKEIDNVILFEKEPSAWPMHHLVKELPMVNNHVI